jgi:hypothetical protein
MQEGRMKNNQIMSRQNKNLRIWDLDKIREDFEKEYPIEDYIKGQERGKIRVEYLLSIEKDEKRRKFLINLKGNFY